MSDDTSPGGALTLPKVAALLGVNVRTLQRREELLKRVGATKTPAGWIVEPGQVEALADALSVSRQRHDTTADVATTTKSVATTTPVVATHVSDVSDALTEKAEQLRQELEETKRDVARLEAIVVQKTQQIESLEADREWLRAEVSAARHTTAEAVTSNTALAMSLRESLRQIEHADPGAQPAADEPATQTTPEATTDAPDPSPAPATNSLTGFTKRWRRR